MLWNNFKNLCENTSEKTLRNNIEIQKHFGEFGKNFGNFRQKFFYVLEKFRKTSGKIFGENIGKRRNLKKKMGGIQKIF